MKRIIITTTMLLALSACQSTAAIKAEQAQTKQAQAEVNKLAAENTQQQQTIQELKDQLAAEIQSKQVLIEQIKKDASIKITMQQDILFSSSSYTLTQAGKAMLNKFAQSLNSSDNSYKHIRIVGHTDNMPVMKKWELQFIDNWDLSARRAAAVARYLIWGQHISPEKISIIGRASVEPVAPNNTKEGRQQNRRIALFLEQ